MNSGYICRFKDLTVRTVLLDELLRNPEQPDKDMVVAIEIKVCKKYNTISRRIKFVF